MHLNQTGHEPSAAAAVHAHGRNPPAALRRPAGDLGAMGLGQTARLLWALSLSAWRLHPWRHAAAWLAVALGVALAQAVHLVNASALAEFARGARAIGGEPDLTLRAAVGGFDESLYGRLATHPQVSLASPVVEAVVGASPAASDVGASGRRPVRGPAPVAGGSDDAPAAAREEAPARAAIVALRVLGVDALRVAGIAPALLPRPDTGERMDLFAPDAVFLNAAARDALWPPAPGSAVAGARQSHVVFHVGDRTLMLRVAGDVAAAGGPLAVMDIGAAQDALGRVGALSRIDLRLSPGTDAGRFADALALPAGVLLTAPQDEAERAASPSRAYRVNLTVLALVALFTGGFLVHAVLALGVAQRLPQWALLGVLGLTPAQRQRLVLAEAALIGVLGSAAGLALGVALARLALAQMGGDLGGGYFSAAAPTLHWQPAAALGHAALGVAAALLGAWSPARRARGLPLAQTLKGLDASALQRDHATAAAALMAASLALALAPPVGGMPLAAYASVGLLLLGGVMALPLLVRLTLAGLAPLAARHALWQLALERARRQPHATVATVGGVVAALSLSVALTVMVGSFRESVLRWLDAVLPAPLYLRVAPLPGMGETAWLSAAQAEAVAGTPGVREVALLRHRPLLLTPSQSPVTLIARRMPRPQDALPLVTPAREAPAGLTPVYVSEIVAERFGLRAGQRLRLPRPAAEGSIRASEPGIYPSSEPDQAKPPVNTDVDAMFFIAGIWRDYGRAQGAIVIDRRDWIALTGDDRVNDVALWLADGADADAVQAAVRDRLRAAGVQVPLEFASAGQIRATSLRIFDRSFAVTVWLQAVAMGIGLFGVAAGFAAQVLARRREFGLLAHLGLTRRQILTLVAVEGALWTALGSMAGLVLGLAVAVVLVHVVNPQSFHWTMDLHLPAARLALLALVSVAAATLTAWLAGQAAASRDVVQSVRQDW